MLINIGVHRISGPNTVFSPIISSFFLPWLLRLSRRPLVPNEPPRPYQSATPIKEAFSPSSFCLFTLTAGVLLNNPALQIYFLLSWESGCLLRWLQCLDQEGSWWGLYTTLSGTWFVTNLMTYLHYLTISCPYFQVIGWSSNDFGQWDTPLSHLLWRCIGGNIPQIWARGLGLSPEVWVSHQWRTLR